MYKNSVIKSLGTPVKDNVDISPNKLPRAIASRWREKQYLNVEIAGETLHINAGAR